MNGTRAAVRPELLTTLATMPAVRLKTIEFDSLCAERGWTGIRQCAEAIGVAGSTLSRVRNGFAAPGRAFIAGCIATFGIDAATRLFEEPEADR